LQNDDWNIFFIGKIYSDGRCVVPIKKISILPVNCEGTARFEVIIGDSIFVPWEQPFVIASSKKISFELKTP
jgi:hypothetical protein